MRTEKKIVIINQPLKNRGDEAAHRSLVRMLLINFDSYKINVVFIGRDLEAIRQILINDNRVEFTNIKVFKGAFHLMKYSLLLRLNIISNIHPTLRKYKKIIKNADHVINAPGGIDLGTYKSWEHLWCLSTATEYNHSVIYYSRSIGPFYKKTWSDKRFYNISMNTLKRTRFLSLRDETSQQFARHQGIKYTTSIDTAFLDVPKDTNSNLELRIKKNYAIFVPNQLNLWHPEYKKYSDEQFLSLYSKIIKVIISSNKKVVLLPQLYLQSPGDWNYFQTLKEYCGNENIMVIPENTSSDEQQNIIANSSLVVGGRYHSIVFAINNQVRFLALSYEHKISGMLKNLDLVQYCFPMHQMLSDINTDVYDSFFNSLATTLQSNHISNSDRDRYKKALHIANDCKNELITRIS